MRKASSKKPKQALPDPDRKPAPGTEEVPAAGIVLSGHDSNRPKRARKSLPESESVLRSFFDSDGVMRGIVEVTAGDDVRHITDNATAASFIGLTPEAMKNKSGSELGEPRDILQTWIFHCNKCRKKKKPVSFEYMDCRGKPEAWLLATVSYLGKHARAYPRFAYVILNITERKRAESALRESEERMRFALEIVHTGAWDLDLATHTAFRSLDHDRIFGYTDLLPQWTYEMFLDHVIPEDRAGVDEKFRHAVETQGDWNFECRIQRKDDGIRWIRAAGRYRPDGPDSPGRMAGIVQDITERKLSEAALKESEERFRVIAETSPVLFSVSSLSDGSVLFTNPAYDRTFGFQPGEITGMPAADRFYDAAERSAFIKTLNERGEIQDREVRVIRKDGTPFWISSSLSRIRFDGIDAMLGASIDITKRKLAEEALLNARNDLEVRVRERTAELKEAVESISTERHRLYDVLEGLPVYVCLLDKDYRMPFANRYFRETFKEPAGRRCYEFLFNRTEPCETCDSYTVMKTHAPHHWYWTGPNGRDYDIYDFPFTDTDGTFMILEMGIDITERKAAETRLKEANSYNRILIEASLDPLVTISADGTISDVNEATIRVTGFTRAELIGTDFSDYFTEPAKAKAGYKKVFHDGSVTDYALEIRHRDGHVTPVLYNASVYRDSAGYVLGVFASARDITERKKAEDAIRKAHDLLEVRVKERTAELVQANVRLRTEIEERRKAENTLRETSQYLENLINYANAPIIVWDPEFKITLFNRAFEHLTDWAAADVIGKPLDIILPKGCLTEVMALIRKTVTGERWESVEIPILHRNGGIRMVLWNSAPIYGADGKTIISIIAQGQDITDRKKIESEYRLRASEYAKMNVALEEEIRQRKESDATLKKTLSLLNASLESTADGIFVVDQLGRITGYNQNFMSMWDIPSALLESGENEKVINFVLPQLKDPKGFLASIRELHANPGRESFDMIEFADGKIFERYSKPQKIGDSVVGRVWSYRDITDRKHAEERLVASLQEKEVLLREIHHRVKNNLQLISGLLDMTRMRTGDESTNEILTDMMLKIQTMAQIHTRLYESKQFGKVSLTGQIRDQIAGLSNIYSHKGHEISCEIHSDEIFLPVDQAIPCALVVNEVLSNAYKHAFKGRKKGTIEISVMEGNGRISIAVRDNGIGLPADFDISRTSSLGLKLIRTLVSHQLKGSFTLRSQDGTEMSMEFPVMTAGT